ncbi:MAG: hypothetical protein WC389_18055 [Lutibacter sp.]|jgi:hypothetical protein
MSYIKKQPRNFMESLQLIHFSFVFIIVAFGAYVALSIGEDLFFSYQEDRMFLYLAIIISFAGNLTSKYLYAKLLRQIPADADLSQKTVRYTTAHIFRIVMLELPALMCVIFAMQSNNSFYFILVGILILMILSAYPTKYKFANEVPLSAKEKSMLENL